MMAAMTEASSAFPLSYLKKKHDDKASKTEILDLCQLPRPLCEIHKMINLPASVKIFKNKLRN